MGKLKSWRVLEVFGVKVPVYLVQDLEGMFGVYDTKTKTILLEERMRGQEREKVLVHEAIHATMDRLYLDAELDAKFIEALVENITVAIFENFSVKWKPR